MEREREGKGRKRQLKGAEGGMEGERDRRMKGKGRMEGKRRGREGEGYPPHHEIPDPPLLETIIVNV